MHVILSVPIPSEAARFIGHILSNINSIVLDKPNPLIAKDPPFIPGELLPAFAKDFFVGELILFLPAEVVEAVPFIFDGEAPSFKVCYLLLNFYLVSYTKSTAY